MCFAAVSASLYWLVFCISGAIFVTPNLFCLFNHFKFQLSLVGSVLPVAISTLLFFLPNSVSCHLIFIRVLDWRLTLFLYQSSIYLFIFRLICLNSQASFPFLSTLFLFSVYNAVVTILFHCTEV